MLALLHLLNNLLESVGWKYILRVAGKVAPRLW